jgi:mRNA-degrading endonuclease RelE of RelBE toxin-antitoxin system
MAVYEIKLSRSAIADMDRLRKYDATTVADAMEKHLAHEPRKESKSRIRRLRGLSDPDYRSRVGDFRVFYNVDDAALRVDVLRVMHKDETRYYHEELEP